MVRQDSLIAAPGVAALDVRRGCLQAIVFDVDGTLADTEREGHLAACNHAFEALGLPIKWTWEEYRELLRIPGNENRMRLALAALGTLSPEQVDDTAAELFRLKEARYIELAPRLQLRPGVERLVEEAATAGVRLAIVSTSSEPQIHALLGARLPRFAHLFRPVLGRQSGRKVGADGALYELCLRELGVPPARVVAVEDAEDGFRAALRAGLRCIVVPSGYAAADDFSGAALVVPTLESVSLGRLEELSPPAA